MNYSKIKLEIEKQKLTIKDFCQQVGITEQGFHKMLKNQSVKVDVLERISNALRVPISYWFENEGVMPISSGGVKGEPITTKRIDSVTAELNKVLKALLPQ